jgi:hypothetical protein
MILYRPVGHKELELICEAGFRAFPPRLPDQPIFYPVLNASYARQIAEGWNTKSGTYSGYITRFNIKNEYAGKFQKQIVGGGQHEELWVPAEELTEFNNNIIGHIEVIAAYFGEGFIGSPPDFGFTNKSATADEYLQLLLNTLEYNYMDFRGSIVMNYRSVFCNYSYWKQLDIDSLTAKDKNKAEHLVPAIADAWHSNFPGIALPMEAKIAEYEQKQLI